MEDNLMFGEVGIRALTASLSQGSRSPARLGNMGDLIMSQLHGSRYESSYRERRFGASNQAAVATTAGLATTFTGLAVANPAGSGYNLVLDRFSYANTVAVPTACAIGLMTGAGAAAGSLTVRNKKTGSTTASIATASAGATIATPVLEEIYSTHGTIATTGQGSGAPMIVELDGGLIIPPGYFVASYTSAATTAAFIFSLSWTEVPI